MNWLDELFSTYEEWHYFIVGVAVGLIVLVVLLLVLGRI